MVMLEIKYVKNDGNGDPIFCEVGEDQMYILADPDQTLGDLEIGERIHVAETALMPVVLP